MFGLSIWRKRKELIEHVDEKDFRAIADGTERRTIVDVRTAAEYRAGHIPGARLIDMSQAGYLKQFNQLDRDQVVLLYCRSGSRSREAARAVQDLGFRKVVNLNDGLLGWSKPLE